MRSVGGGAKNAAWTAIRQRKLGVPFLAALSEEAAAGAARLALAGAREGGRAMTTVEKSPIELPGIASLLDRYGVFFLDQFGVLHDGSTPYPGAVEALERLKSAGKRIVLLSNSGRRSAANEARLIKLGFKPGTWDLFLTSGEVAWRIFSGHGGGSRLKPGAKCLLIAATATDRRSTVSISSWSTAARKPN